MTQRFPDEAPRVWPDTDSDAADDPPFKTLSREEAEVLRANHPPVSPARVVAVQAAVGLGVAAFGWAITQRSEVGWSALVGAAVVVGPAALMARGLARLSGRQAGTVLLGFWLWEALKIVLAVSMLLAAARWMPGLHWPAMLVAMVVCLKVNGLALLWRGRVKHKG
jgi:ATP synthase protein I